jgi:transcriptional regulator with XRE-family HTH domain
MRLGEKTKEFGISKFGNLKSFAEAVGKTPPDLSRYLGPNPSRVPGAGFLKKLYELGCDLNWLFEEIGEQKNKKRKVSDTSENDYLYSRITKLESENKKLKKKLLTLAKPLKE